MAQPVLAAVALGSNVGDRAAHVAAAVAALRALPDTVVISVSPYYETAPFGPVAQGPFLNAAAVLSTSLEPRVLLERFHEVERSRGRDRTAEQRWGPRTLDLDLLVCGDQAIDQPGLTLPHPRLRERAFVLIPLARIAPDLPVPASPAGPRTTAAQALAALSSLGGITQDACTLYLSV